eukprot:3132309-Pyramimonas_sp.AAC.1
MAHYWECRGLAWGLAMVKSGGRRYLPAHVLDRWGLRSCFDEDLMNTHLATIAYHSLRHQHHVPPVQLLTALRGAVRTRALASPSAGARQDLAPPSGANLPFTCRLSRITVSRACTVG